MSGVRFAMAHSLRLGLFFQTRVALVGTFRSGAGAHARAGRPRPASANNRGIRNPGRHKFGTVIRPTVSEVCRTHRMDVAEAVLKMEQKDTVLDVWSSFRNRSFAATGFVFSNACRTFRSGAGAHDRQCQQPRQLHCLTLRNNHGPFCRTKELFKSNRPNFGGIIYMSSNTQSPSQATLRVWLRSFLWERASPNP